MNKMSDEVIREAMNTDIVDFCKANGYDLVKKSKRYYFGVEHDSLVIDRKNNTYQWYSRGEYGNAIHFVQTFFDVGFPQAVGMLTNKNYEKANVVQKKLDTEEKEFVYDIRHAEKSDRAENYLILERGIDLQIVNTLVSKGLIRQDERNNVVFVWGKTGRRVGADLQGTRAYKNIVTGRWKTFKQIRPNSEKHYGFNLSLGVPKTLYFFEAPIDLLSYWSLNKGLTDCRLVSMNGLKPQTITNMIDHTFKSRGGSPTEIYLGVDNDAAGHKFYDRLQKNALMVGNGERANFLNLIPGDLSIPESQVKLYQEHAKNHRVDWRWIAAIHKVETNLGTTTGLANDARYGRFFGKDSNESEPINLASAVKACAEVLARHTRDKKTDIESVLKSDKLNQTEMGYLMGKVKRYFNAYKVQDYQPVKDNAKDWNDVLLRVRKQKALYRVHKRQAELIR